jgi:hypothetical protein
MILLIHALQLALLLKFNFIYNMLDLLRTLFFKYSPWLVIIPLILSLRHYLKDRSKELKPLIVYLALSLFINTLGFWLWSRSINNLPVLHIYTVLEFYALMWFYIVVFNNVTIKKIILLVSIAFTLFAIIDSWLLESIFTFNTIGRSAEAFIIIIACLTYFIKMISTDVIGSELNLRRIKYINSGIFIYFSGSIALFTFSNEINALAKQLILNIWSIHTLLVVIFYLILTISLIKHAR